MSVTRHQVILWAVNHNQKLRLQANDQARRASNHTAAGEDGKAEAYRESERLFVDEAEHFAFIARALREPDEHDATVGSKEQAPSRTPAEIAADIRSVAEKLTRYTRLKQWTHAPELLRLATELEGPCAAAPGGSLTSTVHPPVEGAR